MIDSAIPTWWIDIEQSRQNAMAELESVMDVMEMALTDSGNQSSRALQINLSRWSELVTASLSASESLKSSVNLSQSRQSDAQAMGFSVPSNTVFANRVAAASRRLVSLLSETRKQMSSISDELNRRQPRRRQFRLYRDNSPSLIDVHV